MFPNVRTHHGRPSSLGHSGSHGHPSSLVRVGRFGCGRALTVLTCQTAPLLGLFRPGINNARLLDQIGYGTVQRVLSGALNRALRDPYSPGSALSVGNHYFGPWVCQSVLGTPERPLCGTPDLARIPPKVSPGVAGSNGGPIPQRFSNWFHRYCAPSLRTLVIKVCQHPLQVYTVLQMGLRTELGVIGEGFMHQDPPFGTAYRKVCGHAHRHEQLCCARACAYPYAWTWAAAPIDIRAAKAPGYVSGHAYKHVCAQVHRHVGRHTQTKELSHAHRHTCDRMPWTTAHASMAYI